MSQVVKAQADATPTAEASKSVQAVKRSRSNIIRLLGIGCLALIVCALGLMAAVYYSGVLSGTHGHRNDMPVWSPDGNRIAFDSDRGGNTDIYIMNSDGSSVRQLTRDPFAALYFIKSPEDSSAAWSPDGNRIAFDSGRDNQMMNYVNHDIYVMDVHGSNVQRLTDDGADEAGPRWSPDGKFIAYVKEEYISAQGFNEAPAWDIYIMNADGSQQSQLTNHPANDLEPAWSPDGGKIVFISDRNGNHTDLYVMNADGSDVTQLTDHSSNEFGPAWSPDGTQIVFNSDRNGNVQLFVMSIDGSNLIQLTKDGSNSAYASWSPDGKRIIFESDRDTGKANLYVMNADGSNVIQLTGN